jgi:hypothetical protein
MISESGTQEIGKKRSSAATPHIGGGPEKLEESQPENQIKT